MWSVLLSGAALVGIFAFAFWLAHFAASNETFSEWVMRFGYSGIFLAALVSGFNFAAPIPSVAFLPLFLESGFNLWLSLVIMVLGVTIADSLAYFIGLSGRFFIFSADNSRALIRLDALLARWRFGPLVALFFFAALVPFPNEVLLIPLGLLGYHFHTLLPALILGNSVFHILAAFGTIGLFNVL